jgi:DNA-binding response OmpR family regulator
MSGYDLLREVRADPALGETPFIMVTAESKTDNVVGAKRAGVNNYIVKPFNAQTLRAKIEAVDREGHHTRRGMTALGTAPAAANIALKPAGSGVSREPTSPA